MPIVTPSVIWCVENIVQKYHSFYANFRSKEYCTNFELPLNVVNTDLSVQWSDGKIFSNVHKLNTSGIFCFHEQYIFMWTNSYCRYIWHWSTKPCT